MFFRPDCPNCNSRRMRAWGTTVGTDRLHHSQVICEDCGLVYSNPVCDRAELDAFYRNEYWQSHWPQALSRDVEAVDAAVKEQRNEVLRLKAHGAGRHLLEIGSGTGAFLAAAREEGFETWGIETSEAAVQHSREVFQLENVLCGSVPDPRLPESSFDAIYAWHVIEHVVDLNGFITSIRSLLRPGGMLWIGTENYRNASHYLERSLAVARGRPAPFATASEHTLVFNRQTLRDCIQRRGFDVMMCEAYQPDLSEKTKTMRFRNPLSFAYFAAQHAANAALRTGPLMRLAARKA